MRSKSNNLTGEGYQPGMVKQKQDLGARKEGRFTLTANKRTALRTTSTVGGSPTNAENSRF